MVTGRMRDPELHEINQPFILPVIPLRRIAKRGHGTGLGGPVTRTIAPRLLPGIVKCSIVPGGPILCPRPENLVNTYMDIRIFPRPEQGVELELGSSNHGMHRYVP